MYGKNIQIAHKCFTNHIHFCSNVTCINTDVVL